MSYEIFEKLKKEIFARVTFSVFLLILLLPLAKASVVLNATDFIGFNISASEIARMVSGGLIVSGGWVNGTNAAFTQICLSGNCKTSWPANLVGGTGSANYIAKWQDPNTLTYSSVIYESSGKIGIGTTSPAYKLDVNGDIRATGAVRTDAVYSNTGYVSASGSNLLTMTPYVDNALGFRTPFKVEKWDGSNWVDITSDATWDYLTDGKPSTSIDLINYNYTPDATRIRFSYDFGGRWISPAQQLVLYFQHVPTINSVLVEQADDSAFTTNLETLANIGSSSCFDCTIIIPTSTFWRRYLRITIEVSRPSGSSFGLVAREIAYYSPAFYAGSRLINSMIPIDWDYNKNVFFSNNVGIGTTSPSYKLHVQGGDIYSSGYVRGGTGLCIGSDCRTAWPTFTETDPYWNANISAISTNYLIKRSGAGIGQSIIYDDGSKVGIGTTNPGEKLEVAGNVKITGSRIKNSAGYGIIQTDATDWLRINPDSQYPAIALYNPVAIGTGGLAIGEWSQQPSGVLKVTQSAYLATAGGNVGIGTTSPGEKLELVSGGNIKLNIFPADDTTQGLVSIRFDSRDTGGTTHTWRIYTAPIGGGYGVAPNSIEFWEYPPGGGSLRRFVILKNTTASPSVVAIDGAGNVGIGTTSPAYKLDVQGGWVRVGSGSNAIQFETQSGFHRIAFEELRFWDWSFGNDMVTFKDGNVGIGTTTPTSKLSVGGNPSAAALIGVKDYVGSGLNNLISLEDAYGNNRLVVTTAGNVGIGTTNPGEKLEVSGNIKLSGYINVAGSYIRKAGSSIVISDV